MTVILAIKPILSKHEKGGVSKSPCGGVSNIGIHRTQMTQTSADGRRYINYQQNKSASSNVNLTHPHKGILPPMNHNLIR